MTGRDKELFELLKSKEYRKIRRHIEDDGFLNPENAEDYSELFKKVLAEEQPVIYKNDRMGFNFSTDRKIHWFS